MRLVKPLPLLLCLAAVFGSPASWALPTDREQPIRVQADSAELDDKQGVAVYRGDVVVTQGSMKLTANRAQVFQSMQAPCHETHLPAKPPDSGPPRQCSR